MRNYKNQANLYIANQYNFNISLQGDVTPGK